MEQLAKAAPFRLRIVEILDDKYGKDPKKFPASEEGRNKIIAAIDKGHLDYLELEDVSKNFTIMNDDFRFSHCLNISTILLQMWKGGN